MRLVAVATALLATIACVRTSPLPTNINDMRDFDCQQLLERYKSSQDTDFINDHPYQRDILEQCLPDFAKLSYNQRGEAVKQAHTMLDRATRAKNSADAELIEPQKVASDLQHTFKNSHILMTLYSMNNKIYLSTLTTPASNDSLLQFAPRRSVPNNYILEIIPTDDLVHRAAVQYLSVVLGPLHFEI